jgi:membrane-associated phospholipid phosphatase
LFSNTFNASFFREAMNHPTFVYMTVWKYHHPLRNMFSYAMILFSIVGLVVFYLMGKDELFWMLNRQHSVAGDYFFKYGTYVGDGLVMILLGLIFLVMGKRKTGVLLILAFLLSGLFVQIIKRTKPEPRPGRYYTELNQGEQIHRVDGNLLKGNNSFPSGHTTTAFAMFSLLAFDNRRKHWQLLFFMIALTVGYSRIYLGQHFFKDVWIGALLGYATSYFLLWAFRKKDF